MFSPRSLVSAALTALTMSVLIGIVMSIRQAGLAGLWPSFWATFPLTFAVALIAGIFVVPIVQKLISKLFDDTSDTNNRSST